MIRHFFLIAAFLLLSALPAASHESSLFVVMSSHIEPFEQALAGLRGSCSRIRPIKGLKTVQPLPVTEIILTEETSAASVRRQIAEHRPCLVFAIGTNALEAVKRIKNIPIVYLMVPFPETMTKGHPNITGVNMMIPPARKIRAIIEALPSISKIGSIYSQPHTAELIDQYLKASAKRGITFVAKRASSAKEVQSLLQEMKGRIDAFLMLPDIKVITPETMEVLLLFSLENAVPILSFSEKYLHSGAALAVTFDNYGMGRQAGEMAEKIIAGRSLKSLPPENPDDVRILINPIVMKKLGLQPEAGTNILNGQ